MKKIIGILIVSLGMAGCLSDFPTPYGYSWESPRDGDYYKADHVQSGVTTFVLNFVSTPPTEPKIHFNGNIVNDCFTFYTNQATADLNCMEEYIIQGTNTIQVAHENFGPDKHFTIDTEGPRIALREVCYSDSTTCSFTNPSAGEVVVEAEFRDPSTIINSHLNGINPTIINGNTHVFYVNETDTYSFVGSDANGYTSTHAYKADGQKVDEVVDVRVDENMLNELKDELSQGMSNLISQPGPQDLDGPLSTKIDINYLETGMGTLSNIYITDDYGTDADLAINLTFEPENSYVDRDGNIIDFNDIGMKVDLVVDLPWWLLFGIDIPMSMYVERVEVNAAVDLAIDADSNVQLTLRQLPSGQDVLELYDVKSSDDGGSGIDIIGWLVGQPWLRGIILTMVQDVINRNLEEIVIGASFFPTDNDPDTEIGVLFEPKNLEVANYDADNVGNLYMQMEGTIETVKYHPEVRPTLGSYYVDDTSGLPTPPDNGSALSVAVNSNLVNQMLLAAYNTGITHLTSYDGQVFIGPNATDGMGKLGQFRTQLSPAQPGQFFVDQSSTTNAWLEYYGAHMQIDWHDGVHWKTLFEVDVDISAGVKMRVINGKLGMTLLNTPHLVIRDVSDIKFDNGSFSFLMNGNSFVKGLAQNMVYWAVPFVIESEMIIDISRAGLSERFYTEDMNADEGHLTFEMGVN